MFFSTTSSRVFRYGDNARGSLLKAVRSVARTWTMFFVSLSELALAPRYAVDHCSLIFS